MICALGWTLSLLMLLAYLGSETKLRRSKILLVLVSHEGDGWVPENYLIDKTGTSRVELERIVRSLVIDTKTTTFRWYRYRGP